ncbi:MAG: TlpA family protein disulfide reductase [Halodesulfovibrio sp.]
MGWVVSHPEALPDESGRAAPGTVVADVHLSILGGDADRAYLGLPEGAVHMSFAAIRAHYVVVQFFNCLCADCLRELAQMDALREELELKNLSGDDGLPLLRVIGIAVHDEARRVAAFRKKQKTGFPLFVDRSATLLEGLGITAPPAACLLERTAQGMQLRALAAGSAREREGFVRQVRGLTE